jgi:hypothetical protein
MKQNTSMTLNDLAGTDWAGTAELWLDPQGNDARISTCTLHVEPDGLRYTWQYENTPHEGRITVDGDRGEFVDSWHSPAPMRFARERESPALIALLGSYQAGEGPPWGWRLLLSLRPPWEGAPERLVLQMTNITPWGEEARAVRMIGERR